MYIGIEMGGTKVVIATGTGPDDLTTPIRIPTRDPDTTVTEIIKGVRELAAGQEISGIGVATFGPVGLRRDRPHYGHILRTSKPKWSGFDILGPLQSAFPAVAIAIDTDVNGAALGEQTWGAGKGLRDFAYVTVGTGIGVGVVSNGAPVHGRLHPEAGHILVRRDPARDPFEGRCPFHGDCLEGLASGPTLFDRTGVPGEALGEDHPIWPLIGNYLSQLYMNLALVCSPQRIIVGGGLGLNNEVLAFSRHNLRTLLSGYVETLEEPEDIERFVVSAELGDRAGVLGAIHMAKGARL